MTDNGDAVFNDSTYFFELTDAAFEFDDIGGGIRQLKSAWAVARACAGVS